MKNRLCTSFVATLCGVFALSSLFAAEKVVTWSLAADWEKDVSLSLVDGYRVITSESLIPRMGHGQTGDPDLPFLPVTLDFPASGSFVSLDVEATWTAVESGVKPMPIFEPTPIGSTSTFPALNKTYTETYPAVCYEKQGLVRIDRKPKVSVSVTPFKWDGAAETLYKAKTITIRATFTVPDSGIQMPLKSTDVPCPTSEKTAAYGDDHTADFVIISPPKFVALWAEYAKFRKGTKEGASHTFAVKSTADIYSEYADGDDPLKIHHYIEHLYAKGHLKYILLGAAPRKAGYNRETMIPGRYVSVGTSPNAQILDQYYACMDRLPLDSNGNETGKEVWDWNGDGVYIGTKNSDGSYDYETNFGVNYVDANPDIVVFRFPLMDRVTEEQRTTTNYGYSYVVNSRTTLTAGEIITNFMAKVTRADADDFAGRYGACYGGSRGFSSSKRSSVSSGPLVDERAFFDGGLNMFAPQHPMETTDAEAVPRDRHWDHFTRNRAGNIEKTIILADSYKSASASTFYASCGDVLNNLAHGWARGCSPLDVTSVFFSTGLYKIYCCPLPCDSGMMDYCAGGSSGVTNTISMGEAPILSPKGGALASFFNTRNGWFMGYSTSWNNGGSGLSVRMDYLLFGALSGSFTNGEPLNAGEAHKLAVKKYGANHFSNNAGYSSLQVTGFGDPLVTFSPQFSRVWDKTAANTTWSATEKNWLLTNGTEAVALDYSPTLSVDLADKGDVSFTVDGTFSAANLVLSQDAGATVTLAGAGHFRTTKETVVTNGNLRWEVAGGAGRNGVRFVGARGDLILSGDATRYFGDTFSNVGTIRVTGSNVTIDTPCNAKYGSGNNVDFQGLAFVGEGATTLTNNVLRSRTRKFFPSSLVVPVVNTALSLQCVDAPALAVTNATITTAVNPLWQRMEFLNPITLADSTLSMGYETTRLGSEDGGGLDLTVSGSSRIESKTELPVNEDLRIVFAGSSPVLTIAAPIVAGVKGAKMVLSGAGTLKLTTKTSLDEAITVGEGQTLECTASDVVSHSIVVEKGGTLKPDVLPLTGLKSVTVKAGGSLRLPEPTQSGLWRLVDATSTTITLEEGAQVYDKDGNLLSGEVTQGYYILSSSQLRWKASSGGLWNTNATNTATWESAAGVASAYANGMLVKFSDFEGVSEVAVSVGDNVAPKFILFENAATRYVFSPVEGTNATLTIDSLVLSTPLTFKNPLWVREGIGVTASDLVFGDISAPKLEIAKGATARVTGTISSAVKKLRFEFSATQNANQKTAIGEFRLFDAAGHFYLPVGTVIRDSDGESMTVTSTTPQNDEGQSVSGSSGNEKLAALIDGKLGSNNKWWAQKTSVTWFEIVFPEAVSGLVGYELATSDYRPRDPKAWKVYAGVSEDSLEQIAEVTGHTGANAYQWYTNSAGEKLFTFDKPLSSSLRVYEGGTLHLDGTLVGALTADAGAILKADGASVLKGNNASLVVPSDGTVTIDLSMVSETSTPFPVLTGFNVSADDFQRLAASPSTATLLLKDGDVYAATANVREGPYAATISASANWSELIFTDGAGETFTWSEVNTRPQADITLTVTADATVKMDASGTAGMLTIKGAGNLTLDAVTNAFIPQTIDDSAQTGALVWNLPIGSTKVVAGAKTTIGGGAAGSGSLTVDAGKCAVLGAGVSFAEYTIDPKAQVRFNGTRTNVVLADYPAATYAFENATLSGSFDLAAYTLRVSDGDSVTLKGASSDGWETLLMNFDIAGGTVAVDVTSVKTRFGSSGDTLTTFKMTGGTFAYNGVGVGTGEGLVIGDGAETNEAVFALQIAGGTFSVSNAFVTLCRASSFEVGAGGLLRMKGLASSGAAATISLSSDDDAKPARLEIGSLGLARDSFTSFSALGAVEIVSFESGASVAGDWSIGATKKTSLHFGALDGATLDLADLALTRGTETTVAFGSASDAAMTGLVTPTLTLTGLGAWTLESGTVDMSEARNTADMTLAAKPTGGAIRVLLNYSEYVAGQAFNLFTCGDWAKSLDDAALHAFVSPFYENTKGDAKEEKTGILSSDGAVVVLTRDDSSTRSISVTATVTADAAWSSLSWTTGDGTAYSGNWSDVASAELIVGESTTSTVTLSSVISVPRLITNVKGSLTVVTSGRGSLTVTEYLNDAASTGTTILAATVGADANVDAGLALTFTGAADQSVTYDTLNVPTNGVVTIVDGTWNGTIKIPNTSSKIIYKSANAVGEIYHADGLKGTVEYRLPITVNEAVFGSTDDSAATGTFVLGDGASLNPSSFVAGAGKGTSVTMTQTSGSSLTVTGDSDNSFVLARDSGSVVKYAVQGGTFVSDSAPLVLGGEGTASLSFSGSGTYRLKGIRGNSKSSLSIGSSLTIGSDGISLATSSETPFNGTITTTADATISAPKGLKISGDGNSCSYLVASAGTTMHVNAPIVTGSANMVSTLPKLSLSGSGTVCFDADQPAGGYIKHEGGTLRLSKRGVLGERYIWVTRNPGCKIEVLLTDSETKTNGAKYELFRPYGINYNEAYKLDESADIIAMTKVYNATTGEEVTGTISYEPANRNSSSNTGTVYFTVEYVAPGEVIGTTLSRPLPVTGAAQEFTYVYKPSGTDDQTWATTSNWKTVEILKSTSDGTISTNYVDYTADIAPGCTDGASAAWEPVLLDGVTVKAAQLEGWCSRYGLYNGANVTVDTQVKFQGTPKFIAVDETSRFTVNAWGDGNSADAIDFYVAAPSGIVFNVVYNRTYTSVNYYIGGSGSVYYAKNFTAGTHTLKVATIELGDSTLTGRAIQKKYLVIGSGTLVTSGATVEGGTLKASAVAVTDAVGTYYIGQDATGWYIEWVAYAEKPDGIFFTDSAGKTYEITGAFTKDANGTWVLDGAKSVTVKTSSSAEETIFVMPELATIENDESVSLVPFVLVESKPVLGVKTIPGLTYGLYRTTELGTTWTSVMEEKADGCRVKFEDANAPAGKAFYQIRVRYVGE